MASLPSVGGSPNAWGAQINGFLSVAHNSDGTLQAVAPYADQTPALQAGLTAGSPLTPLFSAIANRNNARADIPVIGDSITAGRGATSYASTWTQQANRAIRASYPTTVNGAAGGLGFVPAYPGDTITYSAPIVLASGTPSSIDLGPIRQSQTLYGACSFTFTAPTGTTSVRVMYYDTSIAGTFTYKVGSGGTTTVTNTGTFTDKLTSSITLTGGQVLTIAWASGNAIIDGIIHYAGDESSGITFHNCGESGWDAGTETSVGWNVPELYALNWAQVYANAFPNPAAIGIMLGTNDASTSEANRTAVQFQSDLAGLISTIRGAASTLATIPLLIITTYGKPETVADTGGWPAYIAAMRAAATADGNSYVIDLNYRMVFGASGPLQYDSWHPSNTGHALIGEIVAAGVRIA
jgi:lysophospholipase L1-like esterase